MKDELCTQRTQKQMPKAIPTRESAFPRVAGVETSERIALYAKNHDKNKQDRLLSLWNKTNMDSCTLPSLIPPMARASTKLAKVVD